MCKFKVNWNTISTSGYGSACHKQLLKSICALYPLPPQKLMINFCALLYSGDKEKELWPHSDYRSKFLGEQVGKRDVLQPFDKIAGPPTIRGDARTHHLGHFTTTTKSEFVGRYLPRHKLLDSSLRVRKEISNK